MFIREFRVCSNLKKGLANSKSKVIYNVFFIVPEDAILDTQWLYDSALVLKDNKQLYYMLIRSTHKTMTCPEFKTSLFLEAKKMGLLANFTTCGMADLAKP